MASEHELWIRWGRLVRCRIVGPDAVFHGEVSRGYLTRPPADFSDQDGRTAFRLGGNRRLAPGSHILESAAGEPLAIFHTKKMAGFADGAVRRVALPHGDDFMLVPPEAAVSGAANKVRASLGGRWGVATAGSIVGVLASGDGRPVPPAARVRALLEQLGARVAGIGPQERLAGTLTLDVDLDARICAGLLLYLEFVLTPSRTPE